MARAKSYPRVRYMGSKYRLLEALGKVFSELAPGPAVDAFSGSGVVSYLLKSQGRAVLSNDQLLFPQTMASAMVANDSEVLSQETVARITSESLDGRSFILDTFRGLYFDDEDHRFLDSAWSHIERLGGSQKSLAISALCLAAARKQPRGVFTVTARQYDDGRRHLRMTMSELFTEAVAEVNAAVFRRSSEEACEARTGDVLDLPRRGFALAYLDPPYAPVRDDTDYIKRYHFLEGLAGYWRDQEILWETKTRKLAKRFTPFAYKRLAGEALDETFGHFQDAALVLSYGSNAAIEADHLEALLLKHRRHVRRVEIPHRYAFGTHSKAARTMATEFIFVATNS